MFKSDSEVKKNINGRNCAKRDEDANGSTHIKGNKVIKESKGVEGSKSAEGNKGVEENQGVNGNKAPEGKPLLPTLAWLFRQIRLYDRDYLPLSTLELFASMGAIYFPIVMFTPLIQALLQKDFGAASRSFFLLLFGSYAFSMLKNLLGGRLQYGRHLLHHRMMQAMKLHLLDMDYPSSQNKLKMESFHHAMNSFRYEIGGLGTAISRIFSVLRNLVSILLALSITLSMLLSPPAAVGTSYLNSWQQQLVEPLWSFGLSFSIMLLALLLQKTGITRSNQKRRTYLAEHAKVEQDLSYTIFEVGSKTSRYPLYQLYDMIPFLREKLRKFAYAGIAFFQRSVNYGAVEGGYLGGCSLILLLLSYGLITLKVLSGAIAVAAVVTYVKSFNQLMESVRSIGETWALLKISLPYFDDMIQFMEKKNELASGSIPVEKRRDNKVQLEFHDVSFKYPNAETWALRHVNLRLDMKQRHAVVGPNGSGKTTLILLLCRLYDPTEGSITLNGVDIRKYNYEEYHALFAAVFQDFQLFAFPLGENVASTRKFDAEKAEEVLCKAGFEAALKGSSMAEALRQPISNFHHSAELYSGGEKQKIAIARAIYKPSSVVILDEPTAALDPLAEADIYARLNEMIEDKTTIFISHRMSSCRFCEDILVFNEGQIVQRGRHDELLRKDGLYREMWQAQAAYYQ